MSISHLLLHRSSDRWDFYASAPPLSWSEQLACWMTADRDIILAILKDEKFEVVDFKSETGKLARRFGVDFGATESLLDQVPLGQEGSRHVATRKQGALAIRQHSENALKEFAEIVEEKLGVAFDANRTFDIASEVFFPSIRALMSTLSGIRIDIEDEADSLSLIFDRMLSVNRRKALNKSLETLLASHAGACPIEDVTVRTALSVIGADSILGALTESFVHEIGRNPGKRMNRIVWSEKLPMSGVPYVDRIMARTTVVAGITIHRGQRIRLYLDAFHSDYPDRLDPYFGVGRHACLGKAVSLKAWQMLTAALGRIDRRVRIIEVQYRKSDFLFNTPTIVKVAVDND